MNIMRRFFILVLSAVLLLFVSSCQKEIPAEQYTSGEYSLTVENGKAISDKPWVVNIQMPSDRSIRILNLTDIQMGTTTYLAEFESTGRMIDNLVSQIEPDLITFTGDLSYGCNTSVYGIASKLNNYNVPWAPVFGNHDFENSSITPPATAQTLENFDNCLFKSGPENLMVDTKTGLPGYGNYVVNIVDIQNNQITIVKSLIFLNSGTEGLHRTQFDWYRDCIKSAQTVTPGVSSAVFMHKPVYGFRNAVLSAYKKTYYRVGLLESYSKSSEIWNPGYEDSFGVIYDGCGPYDDDGFATLAESLSSTDLMIAGHYHGNNACIKNNGITYLFAMKTGPSCYYYEELQGGTAIYVEKDGSFTIRHIYM